MQFPFIVFARVSVVVSRGITRVVRPKTILERWRMNANTIIESSLSIIIGVGQFETTAFRRRISIMYWNKFVPFSTWTNFCLSGRSDEHHFGNETLFPIDSNFFMCNPFSSNWYLSSCSHADVDRHPCFCPQIFPKLSSLEKLVCIEWWTQQAKQQLRTLITFSRRIYLHLRRAQLDYPEGFFFDQSCYSPLCRLNFTFSSSRLTARRWIIHQPMRMTTPIMHHIHACDFDCCYGG